jgi:hypothetical protein
MLYVHLVCLVKENKFEDNSEQKVIFFTPYI